MSVDVPVNLPPAYSSDSLDIFSTESDASELPGYTRRATPPASSQSSQLQRKEFTSELKKKGKAWATLTMLADSALSPTIPTILEGSDVAGSVKVNLDKEDGIHSVAVCVRGHIITGIHVGESTVFLEISKTLWTQSAPHSGHNIFKDHERDHLHGDHLWPFSIPLPKEVKLEDFPEPFRLPQTFMERYSRGSIQYNVSLVITRGKLRSNDQTFIVFGYIPIIKPNPPSALRQLTYQENSPLLGPESDPVGWYTPEPVQVRGVVFGARAVDVKCELSLATPLCYTRGSAIPCFITLEAEDWQALDLLSSPKAIVVRLRRCLKVHAGEKKPLDPYQWKDIVDDLHVAAWWPSTEGAPDERSPKRMISGEIKLPLNLKPTSAMAFFRIEYSVVLFPFEIAGFESEAIKPLCIIPVEIGTSYAPGPRPQTYTPPGYEMHHAPILSQTFIWGSGSLSFL